MSQVSPGTVGCATVAALEAALSLRLMPGRAEAAR